MNSNHNQNSQLQYDEEINLLDLWRVLVRWKWVTVTTFLIVVLSAIAYLRIAPPVYEDQAVIQIGQIGQIGQIEDPYVLVQRLEMKYKVNDSRQEYPRITSIDFPRKGANNIVTITANGYSKAGVEDYLNEAIKGLLKEHEVTYAEGTKIARERYDSLLRQIDRLETQVSETASLIEAVKSTEPSQAAILSIEKGRLLTDITSLQGTVATLQLALAEPQSRPSKYIGRPIISDVPVKPRSLLVMVAAVFLGGMVGIFMAFIVEFFARARQGTYSKSPESA